MSQNTAATQSGIVGYGVHIPFWRLERSLVGEALGSATRNGTRSVASFDEDTTSMAVEAARRALNNVPDVHRAQSIWFATSTPAYLDKTNAVAVREALSLPADVEVTDVIGSVRSGLGALHAAQATQGLLLLSDVRTGLPGSDEEVTGGDAAVALAFGTGPDVIAKLVASATHTGEFLDRWRTPGDAYSQIWEDRFGEVAHAQHVQAAWATALKESDRESTDLDYVIVTGLHSRAVAAATRKIGVAGGVIVDDLTASIGNTGTPHWALLLAGVLDRAKPGATIAVVTLADGASVHIWQTTEAITRRRPLRTTQDLIDAGTGSVPYARFLTWRGFLDREAPRRPEPDRPAAPPSRRNSSWKFSLTGSVDETGFVHAPPSRVSLKTASLDQMTPVRLSGRGGKVATFTVDRLAYSLSPPVVAAVVDFDGGGRFPFEMTDIEADGLRVGDRVELTFRRLYSQGGVHDYFWKARPALGGLDTKEA